MTPNGVATGKSSFTDAPFTSVPRFPLSPTALVKEDKDDMVKVKSSDPIKSLAACNAIPPGPYLKVPKGPEVR
jgi:hypothetical protein